MPSPRLIPLLLLALASCKHRAPPAPAPSASASAGAPPSAELADDTAIAQAEAEHVDHGPSAAALAKMRGTFHQATAAEATDPARAVTLYEQAWHEAPSLAAMLGKARLATAKGDGPLAKASLARALAFAKHDGATPSVALAPAVDDNTTTTILDVEADSAMLAMKNGQLIVRQDLSTGALGVVIELPDSSAVLAASPHLAVVKLPVDGTRLLALGVDDVTTAEPLEDLAASGAAISHDEALLGVITETGATVLDAKTHKPLGKVALAQSKRVVGFTKSDRRLVVLASDRVCILSAPSWNACAASPALRAGSYRDLGALGGELVAFAPNETTFRIFDTEVNRTLVTLSGHFTSVHELTFSPDADTLISSSFSRTVTWDVATHARQELEHDDYDFEPVYSADGKHLLEAGANGAIVRDASALSVWMPITAAGAFPLSSAPPVVVFAPSGHLWVGGNHFVARLDLAAGTMRSYPIYGAVVDLAVSPDEKYFGVGDSFGNMGSNIYGYDAASGKQLWKTSGGMLADMSFAGPQLVVSTGMMKNTFDIVTGTLDASAPLPDNPPAIDLRQATSPDKKLRVSTESDGTLSVTDGKGRGSKIEIGTDAYVVTRSGKSQILGNRASARCKVGAAWLPLDACASLLGAASF